VCKQDEVFFGLVIELFTEFGQIQNEGAEHKLECVENSLEVAARINVHRANERFKNVA
jgi:hypothetical protein